MYLRDMYILSNEIYRFMFSRNSYLVISRDIMHNRYMHFSEIIIR